jgi:uncharacterized protein YPO0396
MIELRRVILIDWYLFRVEQIDVRGMTALIGPNGAGKSAIIDAVQTALTGASMASIRFNASAQSATKSKRSIHDYCLGVVSLDEKGERSEPTRSNAYTYAILGLVNANTGDAINIGVAFSASSTKSDEHCEARFMVRGGLIGKEDLLEPVGKDEVETRQWHTVRGLLRNKGFAVEDGYGSASEFVDEVLRAVSPAGFPLDPRRFIKAFRNALMLKPVDNPTDFVRNYVLDVKPIQVDRLRRSIELYRFLTNKIKDLKAQSAALGQVLRIVNRTNENERLIRLAEWEIARLHWEKFRREVRDIQGRLKKLTVETDRKRRAGVAAEAGLSRIEADLSRIDLALNSSEAVQLALRYEAECKTAIAERANAIAPLTTFDELGTKIAAVVERRALGGRDDTLQTAFELVVDSCAAAQVRRWTTELPDEWEKLATEIDAALSVVETERLTAVQKALSDAFIGAQVDIHKLQNRIDGIDDNLKRINEGRSPIEEGTRALMNALKAAGILAEPICDLVEVTDEKWRIAAEAALGRSREALVVEPARLARALEIYRAGTDEAYKNAEVVNTTKTTQTRPAENGSLATVIATENAHARAFVDFRLGRLAMVETVEKILAAESAITPDRMMQSGRTVKRLSRPAYLKLGRGSAEETRKLLGIERAQCERELGEKARTAGRINEDKTLVDDVVRALNSSRTNGMTCMGAAGALAEFDNRIAELRSAIEDAKRKRDPKLLHEQSELKTEQTKAKAAKTKADRELEAAQAEENQTGGWHKKLIQTDFPTLRAARLEASRSLPDDAAVRMDVSKFQIHARTQSADLLTPDIERRKLDVQQRIAQRRPALQRELNGALSKYCVDFHAIMPFTDDQADAQVVGPWAAGEKQRLDAHELVQYEEQSRTAEGEMTVAFRDDLLHQLHDAFEGIKQTLGDLNRHLSDRQFHGRDFYIFKSSEAATHADMIELVQQSRRPDFQLPLFSKEQNPLVDTPVTRAVRKIETILSNPEAKTEEIEDPRQYFNFELYIQDEHGKIRSSLSSRTSTGSGGEGQLPFYIAIGASLAATYQNKRTGAMGLALAIFDEAFNRLDTKAICACSDFLKDLGLQVVLAAPDEKRHVFMEVVDTVVNVNRSKNEVLVDVEYLTEKTRNSLSEADPYRKGFETFKAESIAAAAEVPHQQAAE